MGRYEGIGAREAKRSGMTRTSFIVGATLWIAVFAGLFLLWQGKKDQAHATTNGGQTAGAAANDTNEGHTSAPQDAEENQTSIKFSFPARKLPDFDFDEVMGESLSLDDLKGKRWVASFVFSRCTTSCPMISAAVMQLHERVAETAPDVVFVTFSVDPKFDTVDVFRQYSEIFTKGNHERWKFVTGGQQEIYELVVKGFGLYVKENLGESRLPGLEVAHSNRVVLVNEDGIPVGTYLGTKEAEMVRLRRILTGRDEFPQPGPGLTFSSPDGGPLQIQVEVKSVEAGNSETEEAVPSNAADVPASDAAPPADANSNDNDESTSPQVSAEADRSSRDPNNTVAEHNSGIDSKLPSWAKALPAYNAGLNSVAAVLLLAGFAAIKIGKKILHRNLMITAFLTSVVFLGCYLTYHYALGKYTGEHGRKFNGAGTWAVIYQLILWPHIVLAALVPIMAIRVFQHAFAERWNEHRTLAKVTFPVWMFVSITGVVIYGMLYHWPWPTGDASVSVTGL